MNNSSIQAHQSSQQFLQSDRSRPPPYNSANPILDVKVQKEAQLNFQNSAINRQPAPRQEPLNLQPIYKKPAKWKQQAPQGCPTRDQFGANLRFQGP